MKYVGFKNQGIILISFILQPFFSKDGLVISGLFVNLELRGFNFFPNFNTETTVLVNIRLSSIDTPSTPFAVTLAYCSEYFSHNTPGKQLLHVDLPFNFAPDNGIEDYHRRIIIEVKKFTRFVVFSCTRQFYNNFSIGPM